VDGGTWLEVTRGLSPSEEVVVGGADALADGTPVRVSREGARPAGPAVASPDATGSPSPPSVRVGDGEKKAEKAARD